MARASAAGWARSFNPLEVDVVVVDEASMLDIHLAAALVDALPPGAQVGAPRSQETDRACGSHELYNL